MLTRDQFCLLCDITVEELKSLNRRDQLPFGDGERKRGQYTPFEAFLLLFTRDLVDGLQLSRTKAAWVTARVAQTLMMRFDTVADTSRDLAEGRATAEVLAGVTWHPFNGTAQNWTTHVGPFEKVAADINDRGIPVVLMAIGNASRAAVTLRARAAREGIDIAELWGPQG